MKALVIYGSKRVGSTSKAVIGKILEGAKQAGYDEIVEFNTSTMNIKGCIACSSCKKSSDDCILNDDLKEYFRQLHTADAVILSSPNYMSNVTGTMINVMNRHYCLRDAERNLKLENKVKIVSVFSQGAPVPVENYDNNYKWFHNCFLGMGFIDGGMIVTRGPMPEDDSEIFRQAVEIGKNL